MNTRRTAASLRAFSKPALAGLLVLLLLISALASASPSLHHWFHDDHETPSHYCIVTVLEHGGTDLVSTGVKVNPAPACLSVSILPGETFFITHDVVLFPERGPPVLS